MAEKRPLKVGEVLRDNDKRMHGRCLTIRSILPNGVIAEDAVGKQRMYLRDRIFTDGKPRKYGLNVLYGEKGTSER